MTADELDFWGASVTNVELAENLAFSLLSRTRLAGPLLERWCTPEAPEALRYCALLALARMKTLTPGERDEALARAARFVEEDNPALVRQAASCCGRS